MTNKFNQYLDNPDNTPQTVEEETVQNLITMRAQLIPDAHFVNQLEKQLRQKHQQLQQKKHKPRWMIGVAMILIIVLASFVIPGARSFAQDSFDKLFKKSDSDVLSEDEVSVSPPSTPQEWLEFTTIAEAEEATQINIRNPEIIPAGFGLESVHVSEDLQSATLVYIARGRFLMISYQSVMDNSNIPVIGNSAEVVVVQINGNAGEYVEGDWITADSLEENADYEWLNVDSVARRLRWIEDNIFYEIISRGGSPGHGAYVGMDEMLDLAENLD